MHHIYICTHTHTHTHVRTYGHTHIHTHSPTSELDEVEEKVGSGIEEVGGVVYDSTTSSVMSGVGEKSCITSGANVEDEVGDTNNEGEEVIPGGGDRE